MDLVVLLAVIGVIVVLTFSLVLCNLPYLKHRSWAQYKKWHDTKVEEKILGWAIRRHQSLYPPAENEEWEELKYISSSDEDKCPANRVGRFLANLGEKLVPAEREVNSTRLLAGEEDPMYGHPVDPLEEVRNLIEKASARAMAEQEEVQDKLKPVNPAKVRMFDKLASIKRDKFPDQIPSGKDHLKNKYDRRLKELKRFQRIRCGLATKGLPDNRPSGGFWGFKRYYSHKRPVCSSASQASTVSKESRVKIIQLQFAMYKEFHGRLPCEKTQRRIKERVEQIATGKTPPPLKRKLKPSGTTIDHENHPVPEQKSMKPAWMENTPMPPPPSRPPLEGADETQNNYEPPVAEPSPEPNQASPNSASPKPASPKPSTPEPSIPSSPLEIAPQPVPGNAEENDQIALTQLLKPK
jgi:hypothetical protein